MIKKIQRRFALSKKGAKDMILGCIECAIQNMAFMFPAGLLYMLVCDLMGNSIQEHRKIYVVGCILGALLILLTTWFQYNGTYLATYQETGKRRITLAEKLRKIPLSFFGKKDLADLTATIMNDCAVLEQSQSHYVCPLVGSMISTTIVAVSLLCLNWKMAIAALWVLPISFGIVGFSARIQQRLSRKSSEAKVICEAGIQECIEAINDLRSNNAEEKVLMLNSYFGQSTAEVGLWGYLGIALVIFLIIFVTYKMAYRKKYTSSGKEDMRLRMELADKIRKLPLSYLGKRNLSDLTSVIMDDVAVAANMLSKVLTELIGGFVSGTIAIIALLFVDWRLALSLAVCLPIVAIVMALSRRISEGTNKKNKQKKLDISDSLQEYLENIKVLRTTERMEHYQNGIAGKIKRVIPGLIGYELLAGLSISISYNVMRVGLGIVIIVGSSLLIAEEISLVTFFLFLYVAVRIYEPITSGCELLGELIHALVSAKRIQDLLDCPVQQGQDDVKLSSYDITFDHVSFGYHDEDVLHDVSFTAKQGEITALVGPSGCGKSTLCKLAARFWDVTQGSISIGGVNVNDMAPEALLKNYSIVF